MRKHAGLRWEASYNRTLSPRLSVGAKVFLVWDFVGKTGWIKCALGRLNVLLRNHYFISQDFIYLNFKFHVRHRPTTVEEVYDAFGVVTQIVLSLARKVSRDRATCRRSIRQ